MSRAALIERLAQMLGRRAQPSRYTAGDFERAFGGVYEPPPVLYRGMTRPIDEAGWRDPRSKYDGTWFTERPDVASSYATLPGGAVGEGGAVYPARLRGRFTDVDTYMRFRREADDLAGLRQRLSEMNYAGVHDPYTRTWMVLDPDNAGFALSESTPALNQAMQRSGARGGLLAGGKPPLMQRLSFLLRSMNDDRLHDVGRYMTTRVRGGPTPAGRRRTGDYSGAYVAPPRSRGGDDRVLLGLGLGAAPALSLREALGERMAQA